jgi:hypothetical protein
MNIVGIGISGGTTVVTADGRFNFAFCQFVSLSDNSSSTYTLIQSYSHPVRGTLNVGGCRASSNLSTTLSVVAHTNIIVVGQISHTTPRTLSASNGWSSQGSMTILNPLPTNAQIGNTAAIVGLPPRLIGASLFLGNNFGIQGGYLSIQQLDVSNSSLSGIIIRSEGLILDLGAQGTTTSAITGTGNAQFGLTLLEAKNCIIYINTSNPPTITGTFGDVQTADGRILPWAQIVNNGYGTIDKAGNRFIPGAATSAAYVQSRATRLKFAGTLLGGASAVFAYLADSSDVPVANNTTPVGYGTTGLSLFDVFVNPAINTMTRTCTVSLYQNGSVVGTPVSIPAGSTTPIKTNWGTNYINFVYGDQIDIRLDNAGADAGHQLSVSVSTEGP